MDILKLKPANKNYLWGGNKLREKYNKESKDSIIAETWEISSHPDGPSIIINGKYKGKTFKDYLDLVGNKVIGKNYNKDRFPILVKFIDAKSPLSIQVHPDDQYALVHEGDFGKTELWYVLEAEKDSFLYKGLKKEITKEELKQSIDDGSILNLLYKLPVKRGDTIFIEAGTIHAINRDIMVCEIQQNSNITYRVYDYKRLDKLGKQRELHIDKALDVAKLKPSPENIFSQNQNINKSLIKIGSCDYFTSYKGSLDGREIIKINDLSFHAINFIDGEGSIQINNEILDFIKGDSFFIPAQNNNYSIQGRGEFILTSL